MRRESDKVYDARRMTMQSAKGNVWCNRHPGYDAKRMRERRAKFGRDPTLLDEVFEPLVVKDDAVLVAGDWHIPFYDREFADFMLEVADDMKIKTLIVPGDFWDCDNYSRFTHLSWGETFRQEIMEVRSALDALLGTFEEIYFCRGNHEKRWIDGNMGRIGMKELFAMTLVSMEHIHTTLDDRITLFSGDRKWLLCHPRSFRQTNLSVAKDLCAKYRMDIFCAHGHQWAQGVDRSGHYMLVDGGGMFDPHAMEYLRSTSTYPAVQGGFYTIVDGRYVPYENDSPRHKVGGELE